MKREKKRRLLTQLPTGDVHKASATVKSHLPGRSPGTEGYGKEAGAQFDKAVCDLSHLSPHLRISVFIPFCFVSPSAPMPMMRCHQCNREPELPAAQRVPNYVLYPAGTSRSYSSGVIRSKWELAVSTATYSQLRREMPIAKFMMISQVANQTHISSLHRLPRPTSRPAGPRATSRPPQRMPRPRLSRPPTSSTALFRRVPPRPRVASQAGLAAASRSVLVMGW
jgi:hypothetical protein